MHRPLTVLGLAVVALAVPGGSASSGADVATTVYVGRHFEVRDRDQPVKYVFSDDTRVARVTGSLSPNLRLQRLRLHTGWNLISLAVTASNFLEQVQSNAGDDMETLLRTAYRWQAGTGDYLPVEPGEIVAGGSVLWLQARTNRVIAVRGDYAPATAPTVPAGGAFVPGPGLEVWPVQLPPGVTVWKFDAARREWRAGLPGDLAPLSYLPGEVASGEAIYVHSPESVELSIPRPEHQITYYHVDHLDSAVVTTDSAGDVVEETAYHPFGAPRHQFRPAPLDTSYGFTQKERDRESRLHYFEARHLAGSLARFLSFDPLVQRLEALEDAELKNLLVQPAKLNPFAYALNNPVRYHDPDGRDARSRTTERKPESPEPELTIRIGPAAKGSKELSALSFSIVPERGNAGTDSGAGRGKAIQQDIQITRHSDKASFDLLKRHADGAPIKSLVLIVPGKDREYRIHMQDVIVDSISMSLNGIEGKPAETITLNAGAIRFGDPASAASNRESTRSWALEPRTGQ